MAMIAPDVNPEPIPGVRLQPQADATTFGGGPGLAQEGQQIQKIGETVGDIGALDLIRAQKIAQFEQQKANETAVQEATAKLSAVHTDLLTNPQSGMPAYQGKNALAGQTTLWDQYQKSANDISQSLHGPLQQEAFNRIAVEKGDNFLQQTHAHVTQQLEKHDANTFEALVGNTAQESAKTYGNAKALAFNNDLINQATTARAARLGLDDNETEKLMRQVKTNYHETVLGEMVNDPNAMKQAKQYFSQYQSEMDTDSRDRVRNLFDTVPKQQDAAAKANEAQFYKANMRQSMLDMFDGKLTLSEAQRRFRENQLDKSDYDTLASKLSKPDAYIQDPLTASNPATFNAIRQAQLTGSKDPGEIQRMIMQGSASKDIGMEDGKYLLSLEKNQPPTPRDREIESSANTLRDFGNRYFAETNIFGGSKNKEKTSQEAEQLVTDFYNQADKTKAQGEDLTKLRDQILKTYAAKRYPGIGNLDKMPDVVIDVNGKVNRLLSPDQHSGLKPRYKITPTSATDKEDQ